VDVYSLLVDGYDLSAVICERLSPGVIDRSDEGLELYSPVNPDVTMRFLLPAVSWLLVFSIAIFAQGMANPDDATPERGESAYARADPGLSDEQRQKFLKGQESFHQRWVVKPSILGLWGRGPTSNAEVCADCHENHGRGRPPVSLGEPAQSLVVRLSIPGSGPRGGPNPHPIYGDQLQTQGILGIVPDEGEVRVGWKEQTVMFADGEIVALRAPTLEFWHLNFGPLGRQTMISPRLAPPVFGLGLLEAIPEAAIHAAAEQQKMLGFAGHANLVWDAIAQRMTLGRFGLKANQPSLRQQIGSAFINDLGVTSSVYPDENCPEAQIQCGRFPTAGYPELTNGQLDALEFHVRALAVPERRSAEDPEVQRGEQLFVSAQCAVCHIPEMTTGDFPALPQLAHRTIHPYTDLLLHDMGEGLADGRPDFEAGPRDWRTTPLWGLGLSESVNGNAYLLHDGRARNATEAILWHAGDAHSARDAFRTMSKKDREALLAFLGSL
jgi:CxxC motif-containing protein (DUF1111 family)